MDGASVFALPNIAPRSRRRATPKKSNFNVYCDPQDHLQMPPQNRQHITDPTPALQERSVSAPARKRGRRPTKSKASPPSKRGTRKTAAQMEQTRQLSPISHQRQKEADARARYRREQERDRRRGDIPGPPLPPTPPSPPPRYHLCDSCHILRAGTRFLSWPSRICQYCQNNNIGSAEELKWCNLGGHEALRSTFLKYNGEGSICIEHRPADIPDLILTSPLPGDLTSLHERIKGSLDQKAIADVHWDLIGQFDKQLNSIRLQLCDICQELSFHCTELRLMEGKNICIRCWKDH